jgi:L-amino acid N-acyltransferase YncA
MTYRLEPMGETHRHAVIDIYNHYVRESFAAYQELPAGYEAYDRFLELARGYPAVVALTEANEPAGFAFLRPWHHAATLRRTAEITYFLHPRHVRRGLGGILLAHLIEAARPMGIDRLLASISSRNPESLGFHRTHGFTECGRFPAVGRKFGEDFDVVWMTRPI